MTPRPIALRVSCKDQPEAPTRHFCFEQDEVLVGRSDSNDVTLEAEGVSLVHLRLLRRKGKLVAIDSGSTNGTWIDGQRLGVRRPRALTPGACILVGPFEIELLEEGVRPTSTAAEARQMVMQVLGELGQPPKLEVIAGPNRGRSLDLPTRVEPFVIGRDDGCDLQLSDGNVSRRHLVIRWDSAQLAVFDADSKNGFWLNDVAAGAGCPLQHGDVVRIGGTLLRLNVPGDAPRPNTEASQRTTDERGDCTADDVEPRASLVRQAQDPATPEARTPALRTTADPLSEPLKPWRDPVAIIATVVAALLCAALIVYLAV